MEFVQEYFIKKKNENFGDSQARPNDLKLEILADTVYVKVGCFHRYGKNFVFGLESLLAFAPGPIRPPAKKKKLKA